MLKERFDIIEKPEWVSAEEICNLIHRAHVVNFEKHLLYGSATITTDDIDKLLSVAKCFVVVDAMGKKLIGVGFVKPFQKKGTFFSGKACDFCRTAIDLDYQGKGLYSCLLKQGLNSLPKDVEYCTLSTAEENNAVCRSVEKFGFRRINYSAHSNNNFYSVDYIWCRNLSFLKRLVIKFQYLFSRIRTIALYKPGGIKRFCF